MIRHDSSTLSWRLKRVLSPCIAAWSRTSYGVGALAALVGELQVEVHLLRLGVVRLLGFDEQLDAGRRVELDHELVGLRAP